ncbi:MAG: PIN domain-containing protein [bacterium]|nr:PIN domain-containing protein [bacterium]
MIERLLIDAGPLVAFLNRRDRHHSWAREQLAEAKPPLLTCEAVLSETCFLLARQATGADAVLELLERGLLKTTFALDQEASRVREIMVRYADLPASLADACLVRMAELNAGSRVLTIDSDFRIYRMLGRKVVPTRMPAE